MKAWTRADHLTICGGPCRTLMFQGDPVLVLTVASVDRHFHRCAACAGEPVPADLPPLREVASTIAPTTKPKKARFASTVSALAVDWKAKQLGREPGEDD